MISVDNLTVSFGGWDLFKDISFLINPRDRIGLVGKNGAGKTTLLKVLIGEQPASSGGVSKNGDCTVGYLPQQMKVADTTTLAEETAKAFGEVLALEKEIAEKDRQLADPAAHGIDLADGSFYAHYNELKDKLNKLTYRWEELSITLENLKETLAS